MVAAKLPVLQWPTLATPRDQQRVGHADLAVPFMGFTDQGGVPIRILGNGPADAAFEVPLAETRSRPTGSTSPSHLWQVPVRIPSECWRVDPDEPSLLRAWVKVWVGDEPHWLELIAAVPQGAQVFDWVW